MVSVLLKLQVLNISRTAMDKQKKQKETQQETSPYEIISFRNVTKKYGEDSYVLDSVDLSINSGEFVFLIGTSGAGKTTLMRHIVREEVPTSGEIIIDGQDISKLKNKDMPLLRRKIGFIYQDFKLLDSKNSFENVALSLYVAGKKREEIEDVVMNLISMVGLKGKENKHPASLSGGEKQRLAIARALAHEPKILLADEPTGNLDSSSTWIVVDLMKKINEWGTTVIFGTHDQDVVNTLKKRVVHIEKGRIIRDEKGGSYA
jgi:cell division transport system ATP-binding protein